jgi:hypothetical protein
LFDRACSIVLAAASSSFDLPVGRRQPTIARMRHLTLLLCCGLSAVLIAAPALAQQPPWPLAPFTATMSNNAPIAFGMTPAEAAAALNAPLTYVRGKLNNEVYVAPRPASAGFFNRQDQLFLQFRHGRLTGWKGDWGKNWMWE